MKRIITRWIIEFIILSVLFVVIQMLSANMILSTVLHYAWCILTCTIVLREERKVLEYFEWRAKYEPKYYIEYDNALCPIDSIDDD